MRSRSVKTFMSPMTAQAEKRLILPQQIIGNGSMHIMAKITTLLDGRMIIKKWPLLIGMALVAEIIHRVGSQAILFSPMGTVAGTALHFALPYGVVGRKFRLHLYRLVTIVAECGIALEEHLFFRNLVGLVAFVAAYLIQAMKIARPVEHGAAAMAGQADRGTLTGSQSGETDNLLTFALRCDVGAARAMTPLASPCAPGKLEGAYPSMYCLFIVLKNILVANGTLLRADIGCTRYATEGITETRPMGTCRRHT